MNECICKHDGIDVDPIYESYILDVLEQTRTGDNQADELVKESDGKLHVKFECNGVIHILDVYSMVLSAGTTEAPTRIAFINKMMSLDNGNPISAKVIWNAELNTLTGGAYDAFDPSFTFYGIAPSVATLLGLN